MCQLNVISKYTASHNYINLNVHNYTKTIKNLHFYERISISLNDLKHPKYGFWIFYFVNKKLFPYFII